MYVYDRQSSTTTVASVATDGTAGNNTSWIPAISADGRVVAFESHGSNLVAGDTNGWSDIFVRDRGDTVMDGDNDGLPTDWETQFGLDPSNAAAIDGAAGDPDGDGVPNLEEYQRGTHPRGFLQAVSRGRRAERVLRPAAGAAQRRAGPARVLLRFLQPGGATRRAVRAAAARAPAHADARGPRRARLARLLDGGRIGSADRARPDDELGASGYGSHAETASPRPATTWYLAEGSTSADFALFYLLQNPNPTASTATMRYLLPFGQAPIERTYTLAAELAHDHRRSTTRAPELAVDRCVGASSRRRSRSSSSARCT